MKICVFDTETTGLPSTKIINPDTLNQWPHIVQLSCVIFDLSLNELSYIIDYVIKVPDNVIISDESAKIHGITNEISYEFGYPIETVLTELFDCLNGVDCIVGHNISFDINVLKVELLRLIYAKSLPTEELKKFKHYLHFITNYKNIHCTLQDSIELCNIQATDKFGRPYLKYPKLAELHQKLFNTTPNGLHNSFIDVLATLRCFVKLKYDYDIMETSKSFKGTMASLNQEISTPELLC